MKAIKGSRGESGRENLGSTSVPGARVFLRSAVLLPEALLFVVQCQGLELVCLTQGAVPDNDLLTAVEYPRALGCTCEPGSAPFPHPQAPFFFFFNFM